MPIPLYSSYSDPPQKQKAAEPKPYLLTHCGALKLDFNHNHPIHATHTLSLRDVSRYTKNSCLTCLKWDTMLYQQCMLISSSYFSNLPHLLISKLCSLIELLILILDQDICRFLTNIELETVEVMMEMVCFNEMLQEMIDLCIQQRTC